MGDDAEVIIASIRTAGCDLTFAVDNLVAGWLRATQSRIDARLADEIQAKAINDPIWHTVDLEPSEVLLVDSVLVQRLRGIRQLGLAHLVFPDAVHDRFSHTCGIVEAADRMLDGVNKNHEKQKSVSCISPRVRRTVRLAALLHDIGHGPFSHAIEPIVERTFASEIEGVRRTCTEMFLLDGYPQPAEIIAVLMITAPTFASIFEFGKFRGDPPREIQCDVIACILGARFNRASPSAQRVMPFMTAIISSGIDADKMDYLARDAFHSGLPIEFDTDRLISKLHALRCSEGTLPISQPENIELANHYPEKHYLDLGLADSATGSFEQLLVNRAFLYDRLYHHHKVRAADAMAQRLAYYSFRDADSLPSLEQLYLPVTDDTMVMLLGGLITHPALNVRSAEARELAESLINRDLYVRALAFRSNLLSSVPKGSPNESEIENDQKEQWSTINSALLTFDQLLEYEQRIYGIAKAIAPLVNDPDIERLGLDLQRHQIIVDLAPNRMSVAKINVWTADSRIESPSWLFDQSKWADLYGRQKRTGYVFAPRRLSRLVSLAARIAFFERFGAIIGKDAARLAKTMSLVKPQWITALVESGYIRQQTADFLTEKERIRCRIWPVDIKPPEQWLVVAPDFCEKIPDELTELLPQGISAAEKGPLVATINALLNFIDVVASEGGLSSPTGKPSESELQEELRKNLRAQKLKVDEGGKCGGGEFDLLVGDTCLIENKVASPGEDPWLSKSDAGYQARRYSMAVCTTVIVTLIAYKPEHTGVHLRQNESVKVMRLDGVTDNTVEIRFAVPYGLPKPSRTVKPP